MTDTHHVINSDQLIPSRNSLSNGRRSLIKCVIERKKCTICNEFIDNDDYSEHVANCVEIENIPSNEILSSIEEHEQPITDNSTNEFLSLTQLSIIDDNDNNLSNPLLLSVQEPEIDEKSFGNENNSTESENILSIPFLPEVNDDSSSRTQSINDINENADDEYGTPPNSSAISIDTNLKKVCILINESEYRQHVNDCLSESTISETMKKDRVTCFSCHRVFDLKDNLTREISCPFQHIYCLTCLQYSMENFVRTRSIPLCHLTLCDYKLSRYDISLIPLERRISNKLIQLAKGEQRPQCFKCYFYIDINEIEDFYEHIDICDGDLSSCEYCSCLYSIDQIENHKIQCQMDKLSKNDKLINFIMKRTKYPFTKEQIKIFIQQKYKKNYENLDPLTIINALAVYGPLFPCDVPTKECDICMEACPYEDIYVFDCTDNHKLCYLCYYNSSVAKMSNDETLTCGICTHPLRDGELKQLRISDEEKQKFRDYQIKKTLGDYLNHTQGIIKCPNQNCSWIAEAEDPMKRFKVCCRLCKKEFCSLCNEQYHYRTTCQQLPHITQQWYLWCQTERTRYFTVRAQKNADYAARLNDYKQKMNENEKRNGDLRRRYEELIKDEEYKAKHCRICPSCKRVVERLAGCDKMICGQNAHGGNIQSGCGAKFNWAQAQPYTVSTTFQPQQLTIDLPKPEHKIVKHIGVQCDQCKKDVVGIRFDCVHCPTLIYCEKCEQQATLDHSNKNQSMNQQSHVFRLIMTPEEV